MKGEIDTSFVTSQRDLFVGGLAAQIGMNAYGVWHAVKAHSDYGTGEAYPGMRRLAVLTGLSIASVHKSIDILLEAKLLRIAEKGKGTKTSRYVPRERLDIRLGKRVVCSVVIDYVPNRLRERLDKLSRALSDGRDDPDIFAEIEIIPGPGFCWDDADRTLRASIAAADLPADGPSFVLTPLQERVKQMAAIANDRQRRCRVSSP